MTSLWIVCKEAVFNFIISGLSGPKQNCVCVCVCVCVCECVHVNANFTAHELVNDKDLHLLHV